MTGVQTCALPILKLESSYYRIYYVNLPGSIDRELDSIDRSSWDCFSAEFSNSAQTRLTCRVLYFSLSIKGKTLATVYCGGLYCVCESLVRSKGVCLHIHLGFLISRLMSRAWWSIQLLIQELKDTQAGVLVLAGNPRKKESVVSKLARGHVSKFSTGE